MEPTAILRVYGSWSRGLSKNEKEDGNGKDKVRVRGT